MFPGSQSVLHPEALYAFVKSIFASVQVREKDLSVVISTLEEEFSIYKEVGGESVPVHCQYESNGLQKNGKDGEEGHSAPRDGVKIL